jgi:23S rRNA (guanosine2251-2'-O)-methyltransferase
MRGAGRELLYGRQPVREMLRAGRRRVDALFLLSGIRDTPELDEIMRIAGEKNIRIQTLDAPRLDAMTGDVNHQGVAAEVSAFRYVSYKKMLSDAEQQKDALFLFLDHLEDPQNVGSLLRSAEAAGVTGVVIPEHRAVGITAAVVRASAGAAEHLPVAQVPNLVRCMKLLKDRGVWFAGLEGGGESRDISTTDLTGPLGLIVGSEGRGMRRLVREHCDYVVKLPMRGHVESLNAAVAGAIALFEVLRQRNALERQKTAG